MGTKVWVCPCVRPLSSNFFLSVWALFAYLSLYYTLYYTYHRGWGLNKLLHTFLFVGKGLKKIVCSFNCVNRNFLDIGRLFTIVTLFLPPHSQRVHTSTHLEGREVIFPHARRKTQNTRDLIWQLLSDARIFFCFLQLLLSAKIWVVHLCLGVIVTRSFFVWWW